MKIIPAILAGGAGSRLWPLSRQDRPKQFQRFLGEHSLLQDTAKRLSGGVDYAAPVILTNEEYRFAVAEQMQEICMTPAAIMLEPMRRNTAPAMAALAAYAVDQDPDAVLHVMPSDHAIVADNAYWNAVRAAAKAAREGYLVTFGITPKDAATGYGYIEMGAEIGEEADVAHITRFVEKPNAENAAAMVADGKHLWNSGMFMFRAQTFLDEIAALTPGAAEPAIAAIKAAKADLDFTRLDAAAFARAEDISVDYAVFEKTDKGAVAPVDIQWSDLGAWRSIWDAADKDDHGNAVIGEALTRNASNCFIATEGPHVSVQNLDDVAVVATHDAVWVGRLSHSEDIKSLVEYLRDNPETEALTAHHRTNYRPWGGYTSILNGDRFQVKRLFVKPGAKLSLQKHHHRAEHWVIVRGSAEVTVNDKVFLLSENQSTYIPLGAEHRLANPGKIMLELVEVQSGAYLGEDDIIRIEDEFGRG